MKACENFNADDWEYLMQTLEMLKARAKVRSKQIPQGLTLCKKCGWYHEASEYHQEKKRQRRAVEKRKEGE